ncbi:MAG TPA: YfhO family protein [Methylomirabilota bacterium]|nr:YfhO family protein [Methylomirabilota bacterium]
MAGPGLLLVVAMAFFRHLLPPDRALYLRDLSFEVLPFRRHVGEMVAAGTAPWWTPLVFGGAPTVAMVHGLFYPPSAVFFLLPAPWALKVFIVGHDLIAGLGLWALLRALAVSPVAALLGATTYMLSGYVLSLGNLVNLLVGAAWLPWAILCFVRATEGAGPVWGRWAILTGVVLGLQALADVQSAYLTVAILVLWLLLPGGPGWLARLRRGAVGLAVGGGIGMLLAAVQLLPLAEFYRMSVRAAGLVTEEAITWSYDPPRLLELLAPRIWGDLIEGPYWGWMLHKAAGAPSPLVLSAYLGIAPLVLAGVAVLALGRSRWVAFCAVLGGLSVLLALGGSTPLYALLHRAVPFFDRFRYPVKWLLPATLSVALMAGIGLGALGDRLAADRRSMRRALAVGVVALAALVGGLFVVRSHPEAVAAFMARQVSLPPVQLAALSERVHVEIVVQGLTAAALYGGTLIALWAVGLSGLPAAAAQGGVLLLLLADLFVHNGDLVPVAPRSLLAAEPPLARFLRQEPGLFRVLYLDTPERQQQVLERARSPFALPIVLWYRSLLLPNTGVEFGLAEFGGGSPARLADHQTVQRLAVGEELRLRLLGAWNVRFLIVPYADLLHPALERVTVPSGDPDVRVYLNRLELPRALWVRHARWYGDRAQLRAALARFDPRREVLLEGADRQDPDGETGGAEGAADVISYRADDVVVRVQAPREGFVVLADTYYPGWRATVDGAETRLLRANYSMRAVRVPGGTHEVRFRYRPHVLWVGAGISLVTALVVAGFLARFRSARRQSPTFGGE